MRPFAFCVKTAGVRLKLKLNSFSRTQTAPNLVPRAFSSFKMAVGKTPCQDCWKTPQIVEYFVTWHMIKWLFSAIGNETKRRHLIVFAWRNSNKLLEPLLRPWPGVSPTAILNEEKDLGTRLEMLPEQQDLLSYVGFTISVLWSSWIGLFGFILLNHSANGDCTSTSKITWTKINLTFALCKTPLCPSLKEQVRHRILLDHTRENSPC